MALKFVRAKTVIELGPHVQDMQNAFYGNINHIDPRRRPELQDSQMINENERAVANLPEQGYQVEFDNEYKPGYLRQ